MGSRSNGRSHEADEITGEVLLPDGFNPLRCQIQDARLRDVEESQRIDHDSIATVRLDFATQLHAIQAHVDRWAYKLALSMLGVAGITALSSAPTSPIGKLIALILP